MPISHAVVREILDRLDRLGECDYVEFTVDDITIRAGSSFAPSEPAQKAPQSGNAPPAPSTPAPAGSQATPPASASATPSAPVEAAQSEGGEVSIPEGMQAIKSPMGGMFYTTPSPDEPPFVQEGDQVKEGDTLCLVEVMKLFNTIKAPCAGTVHKICVDHGATVGLDEVLMIFQPASEEA